MNAFSSRFGRYSATRNPLAGGLIALLLSSTFSPFAAAQQPDLELPISMDADSADYDGKTSMMMYRGLRLTQGSMGIKADVARASNLDFEDSVWHFSGNVVIDVQNGHIECDSADLKFSGHQLQLATITGSPATFEMKRPGSDVVTYAEARRLQYDITGNVIEFSGNATITEGGNRISSEYLVYNIAEQRIKAQSAGEGESKVKITYTPSDEADAQTDEKAGEDGEDAPSNEPPVN